MTFDKLHYGLTLYACLLFLLHADQKAGQHYCQQSTAILNGKNVSHASYFRQSSNTPNWNWLIWGDGSLGVLILVSILGIACMKASMVFPPLFLFFVLFAIMDCCRII